MSTELFTERLFLRPCRAEDADIVFAAEHESIADLRPWFWWCHPVHDIARCRRWAASRPGAWSGDEEYSFLVFDRSGTELIGCTWINAIDRQSLRGSLGYWIRSSSAGSGFAVEAARAVVRFGLDELGLRRVEIIAAVENVASQRVAQKLGAKFEGVARSRLVVAGMSQDARVFSLLAEDL